MISKRLLDTPTSVAARRIIPPPIKIAEPTGATGVETGSAAQDYIGLYGGDAKLPSESLDYVQRTATEILNAIGADESPVPPV